MLRSELGLAGADRGTGFTPLATVSVKPKNGLPGSKSYRWNINGIIDY